MDTIPLKRNLVYTEQLNIRAETALKNDIRYLTARGVDIPELLRPIIRAAIEKAKKQIDQQLGA